MRAASTDFLQNFRYHATADPATGTDPLQAFTGRSGAGWEAQAGFQSVSLPELSIEAMEYREGTYEWTKKFPGVPTVSESTLMRGVALQDKTFHEWCMQVLTGGDYRCDVTVWVYQRAQMASATTASTGDGFRNIVFREAFPMRAKPGGDLDATSGEVSMAEVDVTMESFDLNVPGTPATFVRTA